MLWPIINFFKTFIFYIVNYLIYFLLYYFLLYYYYCIILYYFIFVLYFIFFIIILLYFLYFLLYYIIIFFMSAADEKVYFFLLLIFNNIYLIFNFGWYKLFHYSIFINFKREMRKISKYIEKIWLVIVKCENNYYFIIYK